MAAWPDLDTELDSWHRSGRKATLWWRDDDAKSVTRQLERLLDVRREARVPLALAVIPSGAHLPLARALGPLAEVSVLQHGFAHKNHAPEGEKKVELSGHRPAERVLGELIAGREKLAELFASKALPVLVPPWNRMDANLLPALAAQGYTGLSAWGPRTAPQAAPGLVQVNAHVDLIDWSGRRRFVGQETALDQVIAHLSARRTGAADADEPTGLLTHHEAHDGGCWEFLTAFLAHTRAHPAVRWLSALHLFPAAT